MKFKISIALLTIFIFANAQTGLQMDTAKNKITIPFKLINNLIFIPITVNGVKLNFLLDTGSQETILFGLDETEEIKFNNVEKIKIKGYGSLEYVEALQSSSNVLNINKLTDKNHTIYIIIDQNFNISSQVGIPVNGIIGSHFFENFLVETNYRKQKIIVYKDYKKFYKNKAKKYSENQIVLENNKPYFAPEIEIGNKILKLKLLIDSGSSDALWIFKKETNNFEIPKKNFDDYLGRGFSGEIYGKRARIDKFKINEFEFIKPLVAFPDSIAIKNTISIHNNDGAIGGEILKRFSIIYDYPNSKIYFKKNDFYKLPFNYNMSGIELQHNGLQWVKETEVVNNSKSNTIKFELSDEDKRHLKYKFSLKPTFKIFSVRKNSPAEKCGLQKEDVIVSINNTMVYNYSLQEINDLLKSEDGKNINILINRNGVEMKFSFKLETMI